MPRSVADGHQYRRHIPLTGSSFGARRKLKSDASLYAKIKLSAARCVRVLQEPPMRDWLFLLAPPALIFYFIAYPDKFYEFVFWAKRLIG
jgi:hypothetical protein